LDADNENKMAGKGKITSKRASSKKIIRLLDADNENKIPAREYGHGLSKRQNANDDSVTVYITSHTLF
jgi:hypothetical protein